MFFKIALSVSAVIVALLFIAAIRPNTFRVVRSITIHAPPDRVFSFLNHLRSWEAWSDGSTEEGTVQKIYSGPVAGTGAMAEWHGQFRRRGRQDGDHRICGTRLQSRWIGASPLKRTTSMSSEFMPGETRQKSHEPYRLQIYTG